MKKILIIMLIVGLVAVAASEAKAGDDEKRIFWILYGVDQILNRGQGTSAVVGAAGEILNLPSTIIYGRQQERQGRVITGTGCTTFAEVTRVVIRNESSYYITIREDGNAIRDCLWPGEVIEIRNLRPYNEHFLTLLVRDAQGNIVRTHRSSYYGGPQLVNYVVTNQGLRQQ